MQQRAKAKWNHFDGIHIESPRTGYECCPDDDDVDDEDEDEDDDDDGDGDDDKCVRYRGHRACGKVGSGLKWDVMAWEDEDEDS